MAIGEGGEEAKEEVIGDLDDLLRKERAREKLNQEVAPAEVQVRCLIASATVGVWG